MSGAQRLTFVVLAGLAGALSARVPEVPPITVDLSQQAQPQKAATPPVSYQDVLFLGDAGPELLRLRVEIDGRPFRAAWEEYLDKLFADLDRDGDGVLSRAEAARAPGTPFLQAFLRGEFPGDTSNSAAPFALLDADKDGRITRHELAGYYRRAGLDAMAIQILPRRAEADTLTDALFRLLDRDGDGSLSREELTHAAESLIKVDLDEDEFITPEELLAHGSSARSNRGTIPAPPRFVLASPSESSAAAELIVRLGRPGVTDTRKPPESSEVTLVKSKNGVAEVPGAGSATGQGIALPLGQSVLDVRVGASASATVEGMHQFYLQQFRAADVDRTGALDRRQTAATPYLNGLFALADRNGDGRLTLQELSGFLELHGAGARALTTLTIVDQGAGLFELLDANGDGRLSLREQNAAWQRVRTFDPKGTGRLTHSSFPRRYQLWLTRGWPGRTLLAPPVERKPRPAAARGPLWFRNMDVNVDGDVSRREFLGTEEEFRRLDTDGDGLISLEEASKKYGRCADHKRL